MFYNGLSDWQDEVETVFETSDGAVTSRLQTDASKVKEFYDGRGKYSKVSWPDELTNFELSTCSSNAAMCCWTKDRQANDNNGNCATPYDENCVDKDPADNTNLCFADLEKGKLSSGYDTDRGFVSFPEDNADGEGAIHCHGLAWSNDEYDPISRYKGNNLFYVSMYDHMHQRGYVKNVPGMPMCGCMDQMPMVTRSDCTQVDLSEDWEVVYENGVFTASLTKVEIAFNACRGRNNRNNDLWAYAARLYDEGRLTNRHFGTVGRTLTDDNDCYFQTEYAKQQKGFTTGYVHDTAAWHKVAGRDDLYTGPPMGREGFRNTLAQSMTAVSGSSAGNGAIIMRICASCAATHKRVYYKRLTEVPAGLDLLRNILYHSSSAAASGNVWGTDFSLHSSYEDAVGGANPWKCQGNAFNYGAPFVGNCSPSGVQVSDQHSLWNWNYGPRRNVAYYVNKAETVAESVFTTDLDIGRPATEGATYEDGGVTYISVGGSDFWNSVDSGRYASQSWTGDIDVSVKVRGITSPSNQDWAKAGIMLRSDNSPDAVNAYLLLSSKQGINAQVRQSKNRYTDGADQHKTTPYQTSAWLRIVKKMETIEFYRSDDGVQWVMHGSPQTIFFPNDSYRVGLAVSSSWDSAEGTFESFNVQDYLFPTSSPSISSAPTAWDPLVDIGKLAAQPAGQFVVNGNVESIKGSGTGIWGSNDSFTYSNTQELVGEGGTVEMYIKRFNPWTNIYARGGIMLRDTRDPNAANVFLGAGRSGVVLQSRSQAGAKTVNHNYIFTDWDNAMWVKLVFDASGAVEAFYKNKGTDTYMSLGNAKMELTGSTIQVGRAVSAGTNYEWALEEVQTQTYMFTPH